MGFLLVLRLGLAEGPRFFRRKLEFSNRSLAKQESELGSRAWASDCSSSSPGSSTQRLRCLRHATFCVGALVSFQVGVTAVLLPPPASVLRRWSVGDDRHVGGFLSLRQQARPASLRLMREVWKGSRGSKRLAAFRLIPVQVCS